VSQLLDLQVEIARRPPDAPSETAAPITLRCKALKLKHDEGMFSYPLTKKERDDLRWYLEDYWKWPFEGFAQRGSAVEQLLPALGQRLYQAAFGQRAARDLIQQWQADTSGAHQISIITTDAGFLSLPWELLHDGQDFLALQANPPISIARRIAEEQQPPPLLPEAAFEKPLHVLLVTARPVDEGQVDARTIAREVVDVLQEQREAGAIELEFLRPPTFDELTKRLSKKERPVHILHFDGHGVFYRFPESQDGNNEERGRLFFEKDDGKGDPVDAVSLAELLRYGGVQVAVLNACQSASIGERDISSSVAIQLLKGGLQAVVAMSASVQTTCAALYVKAFYGMLGAGGSIQAAHEQAQRALREHPERNPLQHHLEEAGKAVNLQDWWLPYLYIQPSLVLRPVREELQSGQSAFPPTALRLNSTSPASSMYKFTGRSAELLQIERSLLRKRIVVVSGFGGIGKTTLAHEIADWLTRTKMYDRACFISFEQGGDASVLLNALGNVLAINDGNYHAYDPAAALAILAPLLKKQHVLIIADSVESVLPGSDAALDDVGRDRLWETLAQLQRNGAGVLITSRNAKLDDQRFASGTQADYREVKGLAPDDAYTLAMQVMNANRIDLARIPYVDLSDLLVQLDHHPLAIRLVLPALRDLSLAHIRADFATLLPSFVDDTETGHNRSLLASLDYSLQRLDPEQHALLPRLAVFEGGANESEILAITEIPEDEWTRLRPALEQAALLIAEQIHPSIQSPFLHFHPVLVPYLRNKSKVRNESLCRRYAEKYYERAAYLHDQDAQHPEPVRALARRELPNLRQALKLLVELEATDDVVWSMADYIAQFLDALGMTRELERQHQQVAEAMNTSTAPINVSLTQAEFLQEIGVVEDERRRGNESAALILLTRLLSRIETGPPGTLGGQGSYEHSRTLGELVRCLRANGQTTVAVRRLHEALMITNDLLAQKPEEQAYLRLRSLHLTEWADIYTEQGYYTEAEEIYERARSLSISTNDEHQQAVVQAQLGTLALLQLNYPEAASRYHQALALFQSFEEPAMVAVAWQTLGTIAEKQADWSEAERCYRESLVIKERLDLLKDAASTYSSLARVASNTGRPAEAEEWFKRALDLEERVQPGSITQASIMSNLAVLLVTEIQAGRVARARLMKAHNYAEQALGILEQPGVSTETWPTLHILGQIADLEGQREKARFYHRRAQEAYVAFEGNRSNVNQSFEDLIVTITMAALGDAQARETMETMLPLLANEGFQISEAVRRIWTGERNWLTLVEDIPDIDALLILRVLESLESI
jgi:tetratricopeptide (TPR) repeat protein